MAKTKQNRVGHLEFVKNKNKEFFSRVVASNGKILSGATETYRTMLSAVRGWIATVEVANGKPPFKTKLENGAKIPKGFDGIFEIIE